MHSFHVCQCSGLSPKRASKVWVGIEIWELDHLDAGAGAATCLLQTQVIFLSWASVSSSAEGAVPPAPQAEWRWRTVLVLRAGRADTHRPADTHSVVQLGF